MQQVIREQRSHKEYRIAIFEKISVTRITYNSSQQALVPSKCLTCLWAFYLRLRPLPQSGLLEEKLVSGQKEHEPECSRGPPSLKKKAVTAPALSLTQGHLEQATEPLLRHLSASPVALHYFDPFLFLIKSTQADLPQEAPFQSSLLPLKSSGLVCAL